jgi:hypothetical protein
MYMRTVAVAIALASFSYAYALAADTCYERTPQKVIITKSRIQWVRLTVLSTYPGQTTAGPCMSIFLPNSEEFGNE